MLKSSTFDTPLGQMIAIADEKVLHVLEFVDRKGLTREIELLTKKKRSTITSGRTAPIDSIEDEMRQYFLGKIDTFKTPSIVWGTPFQLRVWEELKKIPAGTTVAYSDVALRIGNPAGVRAVANAVGTNRLAVVIPCHRVIRTGGGLGGYAGGVAKKRVLLDLEKGGPHVL